MPTRLGFKAVSVHFSANSYLPKMPVEFDLKTRQFSYTKITKANLSKYAAWLSVVFFFFYFISIGHSTYMIVRQVIKPNPAVKIKHIFLAVMMNTAGNMVVGTVIYVLWSGKEAVDRVNWLIRRYDQFQTEDMGGLLPQPIWKTTSGELDTFGIAAYAMLFPLSSVPLFATIFGLAANLDVYQYLWHDILPVKVVNHLWTRIVIKFFSGILSYIGFAESCRMLGLMGILAIAPTQLMARIVKTLAEWNVGEIRNNSDHALLRLHRTYLDYVEMKIIEFTFHGYEATLAFELIECGVWLCAASIFATIRLYNILPFGFYVMFPFFTFAIFGISQLLLPVVAGIHEHSTKALAKWVEQLEGKGFNNHRCIRRQFRALRPVRFIAGFSGFTFFLLDRSVKTYFLRSILDNTITLLIGLPEVEKSQIEFKY
ncbi:hypothetical protein Fcan01_26582 [Folsomia candida]|uniref:Uncharacterized protein n=1 Tax=Folsomia candida TaxID=158441 RepID=A0A226D1Q9_FOLCA|nr:hypothetical protein Fcan01_26582 [Folsomia candida]